MMTPGAVWSPEPNGFETCLSRLKTISSTLIFFRRFRSLFFYHPDPPVVD